MPLAVLPLVLALLAICAPLVAAANPGSAASPSPDPAPHLTEIAKRAELVSLRKVTAETAKKRYRQTLAALELGRQAGMLPGKSLDLALPDAGYQGAHLALTKRALESRFAELDRLGVFRWKTNLALLVRGSAPLEPHIGAERAMHIDHILPTAAFPELSTEFANLRLVSARTNLRKTDDVRQLALDLGRELREAGIIDADTFARIRRLRAEDFR